MDYIREELLRQRAALAKLLLGSTEEEVAGIIKGLEKENIIYIIRRDGIKDKGFNSLMINLFISMLLLVKRITKEYTINSLGCQN